MDIYPQDLGRVGYRVTLFLRAQTREAWDAKRQTASTLLAQTPMTHLRQVWMRGSGIREETARHARPAFDLCRRAIWKGKPLGLTGMLIGGLLLGSMGSLWVSGLLRAEGVIAAQNAGARYCLIPIWGLLTAWTLWFSVVVRPRRLFREMHERLSEGDLNRLKDHVRDPLAGDYLGLVQLARQTALTDAETDHTVRQALSALGEAIEGLPPQTPPAVQDDPAAMQDQAARLQADADAEPDPVVAASLERRAQSLAYRADTLTSIAVLLRRNEALRQEVTEQIAALQTSLSALGIAGASPTHELTGLAANIERVALEVRAITTARIEMDTLLAPPRPAAGKPAQSDPNWQSATRLKLREYLHEISDANGDERQSQSRF